MIKFIFFLIVLIHGLIHLMGFSRAFNYGNMSHLVKEISKPIGLIWLLAAFLFILAAVFLLFKKNYWEIFAIVAVVFSQLVVLYSWNDARYATLVNLVILLVAIPAFASKRFNSMIKNEVQGIIPSSNQTSNIITSQMLAPLPGIVQKWLVRSGVPGKHNIEFVRLKQVGEIRTKQGGRWMPFTATQYFSVNDPQFVWQADVQMLPFVSLNGRDKFVNGKGEMLIKLLSLFTVVNSADTPYMNQATMLRYLAELGWFPTAALSQYVSWSQIDETTAMVSMTCNALNVSGMMKFTEEGDFLSFEANRYMANGKNGSMQKWLVEAKGYKNFNGLRIAHKNAVTWKLDSGDFNWANIELTDLEFNKPLLYE